MKITPIKRLSVAVVPSWLDELVTLSPDLTYSDLLSFSNLYAEKSSIVSEEQVIIYALAQAYINVFTDRAFADIPTIDMCDANAAFLAERRNLVEKIRLKVNAEDSLAEKEESALSFSPVGLMAKEHYFPMLVDSDTLLLIGSRTPVYQDDRAFFNALLETVGGKLHFSEFKHYLFFKQYLRVATSGT